MNGPIDMQLSVCILGQPDFCRQAQAAFTGSSIKNICTGNIVDSWSLIIAHRPDLLVIEAGQSYNAELHARTNALLRQVEERFGKDLYRLVLASCCESFSFIGDLLFSGHEDLKGSDLLDSLVFAPPAGLPGTSGLFGQLLAMLPLIQQEIYSRRQGNAALPKVNNSDWVQSLADPQSHELWMRWIPRYSGYCNENPLIVGDTGTGKTRVAYALHRLSGRKGSFISMTPRDFSSSELIQAELFGAVAGAYTGAVDKWGLVKSAEKGTLFIDELQSIDKDLQGKLITFIENKSYRRVGSAESIEADVRFIFASNQSIDDMISADILRHDFAYRLERVQLQLPPLKERRLDISAALAFALSKIHRQRPNSRQILGYSQSAYRILFSHDWPGNLRQLENSVAQLCDLAEIDGKRLIDESHVLKALGSKMPLNVITTSDIIAMAADEVAKEALLNRYSAAEEAVNELASRIRIKALEAAMGDIKKAAALLSEDENLIRLTANSRMSNKPGDSNV